MDFRNFQAQMRSLSNWQISTNAAAKENEHGDEFVLFVKLRFENWNKQQKVTDGRLVKSDLGGGGGGVGLYVEID